MSDAYNNDCDICMNMVIIHTTHIMTVIHVWCIKLWLWYAYWYSHQTCITVIMCVLCVLWPYSYISDMYYSHNVCVVWLYQYAYHSHNLIHDMRIDTVIIHKIHTLWLYGWILNVIHVLIQSHNNTYDTHMMTVIHVLQS